MNELVKKFESGTLKPKVLTLAQMEKIEDAYTVLDDGRLRPNIKQQRRFTLQYCYDIPEKQLDNLPTPIMKDMMEAASQANMSASELEDFQAARRKLEQLRK